MTTSKTPNGSFFIGCDFRLQSSTPSQFVPAKEVCYGEERNTEFTNKECLGSIRRPFPIGDVVLAIDIESELLCALQMSAQECSNWGADELC